MRRDNLSARQLMLLHKKLCFGTAFPTSLEEHGDALRQLADFNARVAKLPKSRRQELIDSGIAGTILYYRFSRPVAEWLSKIAPGAVSIDWPAVENDEQVDDLLTCLLEPSEDEFFDSGYVTAREWLDLARAGTNGTDFDWLLAQVRKMPSTSSGHYLYEAADLPLICDLGNCGLSKSQNIMPIASIQTREAGMRGTPRNVKNEIQRPFGSLCKVAKKRGAALLDVAMASLAVRHRETHHFNHANPDEVYEFDVGDGVSIAVFGLRPEHRYPLECTMGFLILSNGVPIGYGGSSALFRQANTGINIFDEFRGSEASYLWVQVLRVFHFLSGCSRFIINPYQFGGDNREALQSGAFWFYYRLGFRPVVKNIRELASREAEKKKNNPRYRSSVKTLRMLSGCDMHLTLPGARASELFEEEWLAASSKLATTVLADTGKTSRRDAVDVVAEDVARKLRLRNYHRWTPAERRSFRAIAPIVAAANPSSWPLDAKRRMRQLLRAKGGSSESDFARQLAQHDEFRMALDRACRRIEY